MKNRHFTSRMLICAGALISISGILTIICAEPAYGGILFAAAACMFFAARNFRIAEDKNNESEIENESSINSDKKGKPTENYGTEGMCVGMCLGTAIGTAFGNNTGIGISLGMLLGLAIGTCIKKGGQL